MTPHKPILQHEHVSRMNHHYFIVGQLVFLFFIGVFLYYYYPHVDYAVNGNVVKFSSLNSDSIIISESEDFSAPRYISFDAKDVFVNLAPGVYYWKPANNLIAGLTKRIEIPSEVSLHMSRNKTLNGNATIENVGNVKITITKNSSGTMVGYIVLEPDESSSIEDKGIYEGRQA